MRQPLTPYEQRIVECVDNYGRFVVNVFGDEANPPFSYSVGFTKSLGLPEVVIQGLGGDTAHPIINDLYGMCAGGLKLQDWQRIDGLFANYPCVLRRVDESWIVQSSFASALWFHRTQMDRPLEDVLQLMWPDAEGRFPWEESCADWVKEDQAAMYEPRVKE